MCQYNLSPTTIGWTPFKGLVVVKRWDVLRTHVIQGGIPLIIWKQNWNNWKNPFAESFGWKQSQRCSKTIQEDVGVGENGAKAWVVLEYSFTCPKNRLRRRHLWAKGSCWVKGPKLELITKA
jgi:hypothetical protein